MKNWKIITITILAIAAIALTTTSVFAFMGRPGYYTQYPTSTGTTGTTGTYTTYPSGTTGYGGFFGGMMGGRGGCGGMGARFGYGASAYTIPTVAPQLNITTAATIVQNYLTSTGNANLEVSEVEEYTLNFYAMVKEKDTGFGAFELLVDKYTGAISPEMGPNMMWNTKYGMHNGMMGWLTGTTAGQAIVTVDGAKAYAQEYLNAYYPGTTVGDVEAFYGYYHVGVLSSGGIYGMLSVNSYTGQVWYHTWHGTFIQEIDLS
jgi:hypothetical protein